MVRAVGPWSGRSGTESIRTPNRRPPAPGHRLDNVGRTETEQVKRWTIDIDIDIYKHDTRTRVRARLHTRDTDHLTGVGLARLNPTDRDVPEIGDELAVARALSDLAH